MMGRRASNRPASRTDRESSVSSGGSMYHSNLTDTDTLTDRQPHRQNITDTHKQAFRDDISRQVICSHEYMFSSFLNLSVKHGFV